MLPTGLALRTALGVGLLAIAGIAEAQTTPQTSVGKCEGMAAATIGIAAVKNPEDPTGQTADSVSLSYAPYIFGRAECDCDTRDVFMRIQLSMCLPAGTQGNPTVWVGTSGCSNFDTRTAVNQTQCQQYTAQVTNLNSQSFNAAGGNCSQTTFLDVFIPARALFSPNVGNCDIAAASNQVYIFVGTDQRMPLATCTLPLTQQVTGAGAPVEEGASSGDGAITLNWKTPPLGSAIQPDSFQVLCADQNGMALADRKQDNVYSVCLDGGIRRRKNIYGGTSITTLGDGGTAAPTDMALGTSSQALGTDELEVPYADDLGTADLAGADLAGADMAGAGTTLTSGRRPRSTGLGEPFDLLDPLYVCSERIPVTAQDYTARVDGLMNGVEYQFVVLSIDLYGNATPGKVLRATPRPVDNLYSRYRAAGGTAQGFCFVATAAFGDYDHPQVRVLRAFRDEVLARTAAGRAFIDAYYAASPPLARFIAEGPARRAIARALLWPVVGIAALACELGSLALALLVAVGGPGLLVWLRRRRRRALVEVPA